MKKKGFVIPLLVAIVAVLAIGGGFYYVKNSSKIESPSVINTENWKTYTDNQYGFEIQYPEDWRIDTSSGFSVISPELDKTIEENPNQPAIVRFNLHISFYQRLYRSSGIKKSIVFNGLNAEEITQDSEGGKSVSIYLDGDKYTYQITLPKTGIESKIIESFKLISSSDSLLDWKTYTDSVNGITLKYPNSLSPACANLQKPEVIITSVGDKIINSGGCIAPQTARTTDSKVKINGTDFCLSTGIDVGMGQAYHIYNYTTSKDTKYYTLQYVVHTSNGCGVFKNADDVNAPGNEKYKECLICAKNYDSIVIPLIEKSVSTLNIATTSQAKTSCTPNWSCGWAPCQNGYQGMIATDSNNCGLPSASVQIACPALAKECNVSTSTQSSIKIISPIDGEVVVVGHNYQIKWIPNSTKINIFLNIYDKNGRQIGNPQNIASAVDNSGIYNWSPQTSLNDSYKYKISLSKANALSFDASDFGESSGFFTLSTSTNFQAAGYSDTQLVQKAKKVLGQDLPIYFIAISKDLLILDEGTAPDPRGLIIFDLTRMVEVYSEQYSKPILVKDNTITYWSPIDTKVTVENCPESVDWLKSGLGAGIESHVSLDLLTLTKTNLGETRCSVRQ